jgi:hypothetical protein
MRARLLLLPLVFVTGCTQKVTIARNIHVKTNGYLGEALINCEGETDGDVTVSLDADGVATALCPGDRSRVYLERNGKSKRATDFFWTKSSEGAPDSVSIAVGY